MQEFKQRFTFSIFQGFKWALLPHLKHTESADSNLNSLTDALYRSGHKITVQGRPNVHSVNDINVKL